MTTSDHNVLQFPDRGKGPGTMPSPRQLALPPAPQTPLRYRVRVDLDDAHPPIWRRLELASDLTLAELHEVLQTAMGWTDSHLHHFVTGPKHDYNAQPFLTDYDEEEGDEGTNERDVRVDQVLVEVGDRVFYEYDFGDGWEHTIRLETIEEYDDSAPRARVLDGARACPPEDCGGIGGYEDLLAAMAAPAPDMHQRERLEWLGDYDPDAFSVEETDQLLRLTLSTMGGSAGVESTLVQVGTGFSEVLADLVERSRHDPQPLAALLAAAELTRLDEPDHAAKNDAVRPWQHLLEVVGAGLTLTTAGWLPPAVVSRIATDLDLLEPWMGKGNREQHFPPVRLLRETATALGFLRKRKGELLPTALGTRLAGDAESMWQHLADSLPQGHKPFEQHAGAIMLLAVAAGETPYDGICRFGPSLLWSAGWADPDGGPADDSSAIHYARPTWDVLRVAGCDFDILRREPASEAARQLARAALRDG